MRSEPDGNLAVARLASSDPFQPASLKADVRRRPNSRFSAGVKPALYFGIDIPFVGPDQGLIDKKIFCKMRNVHMPPKILR